jgi:hypothetical protein
LFPKSWLFSTCTTVVGCFTITDIPGGIICTIRPEYTTLITIFKTRTGMLYQI